MAGTYTIDYVEFPSIDNVRSRQFFADAFGWHSVSYSPSYDEIRGAGLLAGVESGESVKSAAPLVVIRSSDFEEARRAVLAAGGTITLPLFEYPGGRRFHFREPGGTEMRIWTTIE
ncbi:MAG: glyoxalase protein [Devosia sp.]|uniref:VOC family protein n=1 Tax=Devosia sp. TaxID=1871048 RepID=UPI00262458F9|nr:VOC family protein [Devosia sp.]MDB5540380.1 glyoxalase protein [Devosia sp.]